MYLININITEHVFWNELENEKANITLVFTWIVFIELNFTVAFLLIRKTWDGRLVGSVGGWGDPSNGVDHFEMGDLIPFYGLFSQGFKLVYRLRLGLSHLPEH